MLFFCFILSFVISFCEYLLLVLYFITRLFSVYTNEYKNFLKQLFFFHFSVKGEEQSAIYKCGFGRGVTKIILLEEGLKIYGEVENVSEKRGLNKKGVKRKEREREGGGGARG